MLPPFMAPPGHSTGSRPSSTFSEQDVGNAFPTWKMVSGHIRKVEATPLNPIRRQSIVGPAKGQAVTPIVGSSGVATGYQTGSGTTYSGTSALASQSGGFGGTDPGSQLQTLSLSSYNALRAAGVTTKPNGVPLNPGDALTTSEAIALNAQAARSLLGVEEYGTINPSILSHIYPTWSDNLRSGAIVHTTELNPLVDISTVIGYSRFYPAGQETSASGYVQYSTDSNVPSGYARANYFGPLPDGYFGIVFNGITMDDGHSSSFSSSPYGQDGNAWLGNFPPQFASGEAEIFVSLSVLGTATIDTVNPIVPITTSNYQQVGTQGSGTHTLQLIQAQAPGYAGNDGIGYNLVALLTNPTHSVPLTECSLIQPQSVDAQGNPQGSYYNTAGGTVFSGPSIEHLMVEKETGIPIDPITGNPMQILPAMAHPSVINKIPLAPANMIIVKPGPRAPNGNEYVTSNGLGFDTTLGYFYDRTTLQLVDPNTSQPYLDGTRPIPPLTPFGLMPLQVPTATSSHLMATHELEPHKYGVIYNPTPSSAGVNSSALSNGAFPSLSSVLGAAGGSSTPFASLSGIVNATSIGNLAGATLLIHDSTTPGGQLYEAAPPATSTTTTTSTGDGTPPDAWTPTTSPLGDAPQSKTYSGALNTENTLAAAQNNVACGKADGMSYPINIGYMTTQQTDIYNSPIRNGAPQPNQDTYTRDVREGTPLVYGYHPTTPPQLPVFNSQTNGGIQSLPYGQYDVIGYGKNIPNTAPINPISTGQAGPSPDSLGQPLYQGYKQDDLYAAWSTGDWSNYNATPQLYQQSRAAAVSLYGPLPMGIESGKLGISGPSTFTPIQLLYDTNTGLYWYDDGKGFQGYYNYDPIAQVYNPIKIVSVPTAMGISSPSETGPIGTTGGPGLGTGSPAQNIADEQQYLIHPAAFAPGSLDPKTGKLQQDQVVNQPQYSLQLNDHYQPAPAYGDSQLNKSALAPEQGHRSGLTNYNYNPCDPTQTPQSFGVGVSTAKSPYSALELNNRNFPGLRVRPGPGTRINSYNQITTRGTGSEYEGILGIAVDAVDTPLDAMTATVAAGSGLPAGEYLYTYTYTTATSTITGTTTSLKETNACEEWTEVISTATNGLVKFKVPKIDTTAPDFDTNLLNVKSRKVYRTVKNGGISATPPPIKSTYSLQELKDALTAGNISTIPDFWEKYLCANNYVEGTPLTADEISAKAQVDIMAQFGGILPPQFYFIVEIPGTDEVETTDTFPDSGMINDKAHQPPPINHIYVKTQLAGIATPVLTSGVPVLNPDGTPKNTMALNAGLSNNLPSVNDEGKADNNGLGVNVDNKYIKIINNVVTGQPTAGAGGGGSKINRGHGAAPSDQGPPNADDLSVTISDVFTGNRYLTKHMNPGVHTYWYSTVYPIQDKNHPNIWKYALESKLSSPIQVTVPDYENENHEYDQNANDNLYTINIQLPSVNNKLEGKYHKISYYKLYRGNAEKDDEYKSGVQPFTGTELKQGTYEVGYSLRSSYDNARSPIGSFAPVTITDGGAIDVVVNTPTVFDPRYTNSSSGPVSVIMFVDWWVVSPYGGGPIYMGSQEFANTTTPNYHLVISSLTGGGSAPGVQTTDLSPPVGIPVATVVPSSIAPKRKLPKDSGLNPWLWRATFPNNVQQYLPNIPITQDTDAAGNVTFTYYLWSGITPTHEVAVGAPPNPLPTQGATIPTKQPPTYLDGYTFIDDITDAAMDIHVPFNIVPAPEDPLALGEISPELVTDYNLLHDVKDGMFLFQTNPLGGISPPIISPGPDVITNPGWSPPTQARKVKVDVIPYTFPQTNPDGSLYVDANGNNQFIHASGLISSAGVERNELSVYLAKKGGVAMSGLHTRIGETNDDRGGLGVNLEHDGSDEIPSGTDPLPITTGMKFGLNPTTFNYKVFRSGIYVTGNNGMKLDVSNTFDINNDPDATPADVTAANADARLKERFFNKLILSTCVHMPGSAIIDGKLRSKTQKTGSISVRNDVLNYVRGPNDAVSGCDYPSGTSTDPTYGYHLDISAQLIAGTYTDVYVKDGHFKRPTLPEAYINSNNIGGTIARLDGADLTIHGAPGIIGNAYFNSPGVSAPANYQAVGSNDPRWSSGNYAQITPTNTYFGSETTIYGHLNIGSWGAAGGYGYNGDSGVNPYAFTDMGDIALHGNTYVPFDPGYTGGSPNAFGYIWPFHLFGGFNGVGAFITPYGYHDGNPYGPIDRSPPRTTDPNASYQNRDTTLIDGHSLLNCAYSFKLYHKRMNGDFSSYPPGGDFDGMWGARAIVFDQWAKDNNNPFIRGSSGDFGNIAGFMTVTDCLLGLGSDLGGYYGLSTGYVPVFKTPHAYTNGQEWNNDVFWYVKNLNYYFGNHVNNENAWPEGYIPLWLGPEEYKYTFATDTYIHRDGSGWPTVINH